MIISSSNKFAFIKGRKIAGTSVEVGLSQICGSGDIITPISPLDEVVRYQFSGLTAQNYGANQQKLDAYRQQIVKLASQYHLDTMSNIKKPRGLYSGHMGISEIEKIHGEFSSDWHIIGVTRNPYSQVLSRISYIAARQGYTSPELDYRSPEFKAVRASFFAKAKDRSIRPNTDLYLDQHSNFKLNFVIRYERLEEDFQMLTKSLGYSHLIKLPHTKKSALANNIGPEDIFTDDEVRVINQCFETEFETFDYPMC